MALAGHFGGIPGKMMLCYTLLITLQASTKSTLRATHIHHGQVSNITKDLSNTGKRTIRYGA